MKKILLSLCCLTAIVTGFSQPGTPGTPFLSIGDAKTVTAGNSGIYYFKINGVDFSTYVQAPGGWVLVASGNGGGVNPMARTFALTLQSNSILDASIYQNGIIDVSEVRFNSDFSTNGAGFDHTPFDVKTSDLTVIGNLRADRTLSYLMPLNDFSMWTSIGPSPTDNSYMAIPANSTSIKSLEREPYNGFNDFGFRWSLPLDENVYWQDAGRNALNLWISSTFSTLPVEISSFTATVVGAKVKINWTTLTEINNDYFTIEKSTDGNNWQALGVVDGSVNSTIRKDYLFYDNNLLAAKQFYRIKQTDLDGKVKFSAIRIISNKSNADKVLIYPNPFTDNLNFTVSATSFANSTVTLFDVLGKVVYKSNLTSNTVSINSQDLSKGIYILEVNLNGSQQRMKVVKE